LLPLEGCLRTAAQQEARMNRTNHNHFNSRDTDEQAQRAIEETLGYYSNHPERLGSKLDELSHEWSIERVLETNASIACIAGLALGTIPGRKKWLVLSAAAAGILLTAGLRGRPPARSLLRRLGFRSDREIENERMGCEQLWYSANAARGQIRESFGSGEGISLAGGIPLAALAGGRTTHSQAAWPGGVHLAGPRTALEAEADRTARREESAAAAKQPVRKPWYRKARYWVLIGLVVLAVVFRLVLTPIVESALRSSLSKMEGFSASFDHISLSLHELKFIGYGFSVDRQPAGDPQKPLLAVNRIEVDLYGKPLWSGKLVAQARFIEPKFNIVLAGAKPETGAEPPPPPEIPDISSAMAKAVPFRFDRIEIRNGEMTIVDTGEEGHPEIRIGEIEATAENIETGTQLGNRRPSIFAARAKFQNSGEIAIFYSANLLSKALTFAGQARMKGLKLAEINPLIAAKSGVKVKSGEFDVFTAFSAVDGKISGGVKPILKNLEMAAWSASLMEKFKTALIDVTLAILSDRVPGREAVAGIIPFSGEITSPNAQVMPAVLSIVRNAFVIGLASGFAHLPPPEEATGAVGAAANAAAGGGGK